MYQSLNINLYISVYNRTKLKFQDFFLSLTVKKKPQINLIGFQLKSSRYLYLYVLVYCSQSRETETPSIL